MGSLYFWAPTFACYNLIVDLRNRAFLYDIKTNNAEDANGLTEPMDFRPTQNEKLKYVLLNL